MASVVESVFRGITSGWPMIREECTAQTPGLFGVRSCGIVRRLGLQICPAEKIGEARVRAQRIEHGVRFDIADAHYGGGLISFFPPLEGLVFLLEARIDFYSPDR